MIARVIKEGEYLRGLKFLRINVIVTLKGGGVLANEHDVNF